MFSDGILLSTQNTSLDELKATYENLFNGLTRPAFVLKNEIGIPTYGQIVSANIEEVENGIFELIGRSELFSSQIQTTLWNGTVVYIGSATTKFPFPHATKKSAGFRVGYDPSEIANTVEEDLAACLSGYGSSEDIVFAQGKSTGLACLIEMVDCIDDLIANPSKSQVCNNILKIVNQANLSKTKYSAAKIVIPGKVIVELLLLDSGKETNFAAPADHVARVLEYSLEINTRYQAELIEFLYLGGEWKLNWFVTNSGEVYSSEVGKSRARRSIKAALTQMRDPVRTEMPYRFAADGSAEPTAAAAKQFYRDSYTEYAFIQDEDSRMPTSPKWTGCCRFCLKASPEVTFKKIAHAFPELIGNKTFVCVDECDVCNAAFGETLENHFAQWILPLRLISQLSGKSGLPQYEYGDFKFEINEKDGMKVSDVEGSGNIRVDMVTNEITFRFPMHPHLPIAVFKTFVKMALTMMPDDRLPHFREATNWLLDTNVSTLRMPLSTKIITAFFSGIPEYKAITAILCIRKSDDTTIPYATFAIKFGNAAFQLCLPCKLQQKRCKMMVHPLLLGTGSTGISSYDLGATDIETNFQQEFTMQGDEITETVHSSKPKKIDTWLDLGRALFKAILLFFGSSK